MSGKEDCDYSTFFALCAAAWPGGASNRSCKYLYKVQMKNEIACTYVIETIQTLNNGWWYVDFLSRALYVEFKAGARMNSILGYEKYKLTVQHFSYALRLHYYDKQFATVRLRNCRFHTLAILWKNEI